MCVCVCVCVCLHFNVLNVDFLGKQEINKL